MSGVSAGCENEECCDTGREGTKRSSWGQCGPVEVNTYIAGADLVLGRLLGQDKLAAAPVGNVHATHALPQACEAIDIDGALLGGRGNFGPGVEGV